MKRKFVLWAMLALVCTSVLAAQNDEKVFDPDAAVFYYLKDTHLTVTDDNALDYAKVYKNDIYKKYSGDEFEWADKFAAIKKDFQKRLDDTRLDDKFTVNTDIEFGDYDFDKLGYKISISKGLYFPMHSASSQNDFYSHLDSALGKDLTLSLTDFDTYNFLPMAKDEAKAFLQGRKKSSGKIDRDITILIHFMLVDVNSNEYKTAMKPTDTDIHLVGKITSIEAYDTSDRKNIKKLGEVIQK